MDRVEAIADVAAVPAFGATALYFAAKPRRSSIDIGMMLFNVAGMIVFSIISAHKAARNHTRDETCESRDEIVIEEDDTSDEDDEVYEDDDYHSCGVTEKDLSRLYYRHHHIPIMCSKHRDEVIEYIQQSIEIKRQQRMNHDYEYFQYDGRAIPVCPRQVSYKHYYYGH